MANCFFNAVATNSKIGKGTIEDLCSWMEKYVNVLFPENGVEYFSIDKFRDGNSTYLPTDPIPDGTTGDIRRIACFAYQGYSEGRRIEAAVGFVGYVFRQLFSIKSFGKSEECWQVARAMEEALSSIIHFGEVPEIVSMAEKLPKGWNYSRETSLKTTVIVHSTKDAVRVATANGQIFDQRSWKGLHPGNAKYAVEAVVKDWRTVLTNMRANFTEEVSLDEEVVIREEIPGYFISNRGEEGGGFYVLPPDGRSVCSIDYLGKFPDADSAVTAAINHQNQTKTLVQAKAS